MGVIVWALSSSSDAVRLPRVSTAAHAAGPVAGPAPAHTSPWRSASRPRPLAPAPAHRRRRLPAPRAQPPTSCPRTPTTQALGAPTPGPRTPTTPAPAPASRTALGPHAPRGRAQPRLPQAAQVISASASAW
ncbi:arabinogalactan protein 1-like [Miscanthus floridulus]|uniref:arabinogalactan protein 1-like n=1 Tax=Miscanthus floridulus TaxID=154761 RepID=UPI003459DA8F